MNPEPRGIPPSTTGDRAAPGWLLAVAAVVCLLLVASLVPPLTSPDETEHLKRAFVLADGHLLLHTPEGTSTGGLVDEALWAFMTTHIEALVEGQEAAQPEDELSGFSRAWSPGRVFLTAPGAGYYLPLVYLPHASALALGRGAGLSVGLTYWLMRMACLLTAVALLAWAFRLAPAPPVVVALLVLPMMVFQFVSPTIDGVTTALGVLCVSLFADGFDVSRRWPYGRAWALGLGLVVLATSRTHLLPMLVLLPALAVRRKSRLLGLASAVALLVVLAWVGYASAITRDLRVSREVGVGVVARYYLQRPLVFGEVLWATVRDRDTRGFYWRSFVGVLGWLDTPLPTLAYRVATVGLPLLALLSFHRPRGDGRARLLLVVVALGSVLLVFAALLLTWTEHPANRIAGVQGRYFEVPALLLGYAVHGFGRGGSTRLTRVTWGLVGVWAALSLGLLAVTLQHRYFEDRVSARAPRAVLASTPALGQGAPLPLHGLLEAPAHEPLRHLGLYVQPGPGLQNAEVRLSGEQGARTVQPIALDGADGARWLFVSVPEGPWREGLLAPVAGSGARLLEHRDAQGQPTTCLTYRFASGRKWVTPGCPPPGTGEGSGLLPRP